MWGWLRRLRENAAVLRRAVDAEGPRFEAMDYEALEKMTDGEGVERVVEGRTLRFWAEIFDVKPNGDLSVCVEATGLPTLLGIKPCYHFHKRRDGSVYY